MILQDPEIVNQLNQNLDSSVEEVYSIFTSTASVFELMEDVYFKQRAEDILSVGKHLVFNMQNIEREITLNENTILIAEDLSLIHI